MTPDRRGLRTALYVVFVVAVVVFGFLGLRGRWGEIGEAMGSIAAWRWTVAAVLVTAGLVLTAMVWFGLMQAHGSTVPRSAAYVTFFVGQLGKYIPGSLWSMGAQAEMARRYDTPPRVTVSAGLLFVGVNLATAGGLGSLLALLSDLESSVPTLVFVLGAIGGPLAVTPPVLNAIGSKLAPASHPLRMRWTDTGRTLVLMSLTWAAYGIALAVLIEPPLGSGTGPHLTAASTIAVFSLAYVVGVVIIIAPAGVGAREATMTALLEPSLGLERSVAAALVIRVLHSGADFVVALVSWVVAGPDGRPSIGRAVEGADTSG